MKKERRLITFRMLKKLCVYEQGYGCEHWYNRKPFESGICSQKTCPIWKTLKEQTDED